jgi:hypothetical protein
MFGSLLCLFALKWNAFKWLDARMKIYCTWKLVLQCPTAAGIKLSKPKILRDFGSIILNIPHLQYHKRFTILRWQQLHRGPTGSSPLTRGTLCRSPLDTSQKIKLRYNRRRLYTSDLLTLQPHLMVHTYGQIRLFYPFHQHGADNGPNDGNTAFWALLGGSSITAAMAIDSKLILACQFGRVHQRIRTINKQCDSRSKPHYTSPRWIISKVGATTAYFFWADGWARALHKHFHLVMVRSLMRINKLSCTSGRTDKTFQSHIACLNDMPLPLPRRRPPNQALTPSWRWQRKQGQFLDKLIPMGFCAAIWTASFIANVADWHDAAFSLFSCSPRHGTDLLQFKGGVWLRFQPCPDEVKTTDTTMGFADKDIKRM